MASRRAFILSLEEGFLRDHVLVRAGERVIADIPELSTRTQIGLARQLDITLASEEQMLTVEVSTRGLQTDIPIPEAAPGYIGVSIAPGGASLTVRTGETSPGYV